ncbi:MAG: HAD family hydrolase [Nitrospirota bacterium]
MTVQPAQSHAPALGSDPGAAAIFDVDNTLIAGSAIEIRFFRYLWRRGLVGAREAAGSLLHLLGQVPPVSLHPLRERKVYLVGKRSADIEPQARTFVQTEVCPFLSATALASLERHRRAGHRLILVTGTPEFLAAPLGEFLKVDLVLAARLERSGGLYTGRVLPPLPYGEGKLRLIETLVAREGLDLKNSYAYGDSPGDADLLRLVGHPLVVNPIRGMGRIARREGWPVAKWT